MIPLAFTVELQNFYDRILRAGVPLAQKIVNTFLGLSELFLLIELFHLHDGQDNFRGQFTYLGKLSHLGGLNTGRGDTSCLDIK